MAWLALVGSKGLGEIMSRVCCLPLSTRASHLYRGLNTFNYHWQSFNLAATLRWSVNLRFVEPPVWSSSFLSSTSAFLDLPPQLFTPPSTVVVACKRRNRNTPPLHAPVSSSLLHMVSSNLSVGTHRPFFPFLDLSYSLFLFSPFLDLSPFISFS